MDFSLDTCPNSPSRIFNDQASKQPSTNNFVISGSTYYTNRMSDTESEIYSHSLIREVMEASKIRVMQAGLNQYGTISTALIRIVHSIRCQSSRSHMSITSIPFHLKTNYFSRLAQPPVK